MNDWYPLRTEQEWAGALAESRLHPVLVFKHSTRCSISRMALDRFDRDWKENPLPGLKRYCLDLLSYREISNRIAAETGVEHQSPQVLLLSGGRCLYSETHQAIRLRDLALHLPSGLQPT